jgi:hypothetical protein
MLYAVQCVYVCVSCVVCVCFCEWSLVTSFVMRFRGQGLVDRV